MLFLKLLSDQQYLSSDRIEPFAFASVNDRARPLLLCTRDYLAFSKEGYTLFEMRRWHKDKKQWHPVVKKKALIELYNSLEFVDVLQKCGNFDFGNVSIQNIDFKFVKEGNIVYFSDGILKEGKKEFDYLRLSIKLSFPKLVFEPNIGITPHSVSA